MAQYTSSYTGALIDAALGKATTSVLNGGTITSALYANNGVAFRSYVKPSQSENTDIVLALATGHMIQYGYGNTGETHLYGNTVRVVNKDGTTEFFKIDSNRAEFGSWINVKQGNGLSGSISGTQEVTLAAGKSNLIQYGYGNTGTTYFYANQYYFCDPTGNNVWGSVDNGGFHNSSDKNLKDKIKDIKLSAEQIAKMSSIIFKRKNSNDDVEHAGTIAQDWLTVLPQVVKEESNPNDGSKFLSMQYDVAALVSCISLAKEVVELKEKNKLLEERITKLENK